MHSTEWLLAVMVSSVISRDVNETGTFETETETTTLKTEAENKILETRFETETGLETTMIVKLLRDRDIHTGCS